MKKIFITLCAAAAWSCMAAGNTTADTWRTRLDNGWRSTTGIPAGSTDRVFDDSDWTPVSLPHDWSITFAPDSTANAGNEGGYFPGVEAVYRTTITLDSLYEGRYMLYLEGAYMNPTVWVNGDDVASHTYGYTSWRTDITDWLEPGDNTIAITVDNARQKNSRWYSGTGLYRPVWLEHYPAYHVDPASIYVSTPGIRPGMAIGRMEATMLDRHQDRTGDVTLTGTLTVTGPDGVALQPEVFPIVFDNDRFEAPVLVDFPIPDPQLWSPDTPVLYTATITIDGGDGNAKDVQTVTFGLRSFDYDAEEGAFLNDKPITLNGACVHHDNGMLGAAAYDAAEWHKARLLKRAGFNAVRTSHNPPSPAFLDACDHVGLLVIDEAFDGWAWKKNPHDYGEVFDAEWPVDLAALVTRDRNHPSVIAWSIGNEILERKKPETVTRAGEMAALCRKLDPNRPVTQALAAWDSDWEIYDPLAAQHDIVGYNYMIFKAEDDHERVPDRVMWQTESYPRDAWGNYLKVRDLPYVIGDFVWTGIDYLGESGIGRYHYEGQVHGESWERPIWPWHAATCGDIDLTGRRKPISYYRDILHNNLDTVYMAVREPDGYRGTIKQTMWGTYPTFESWTWPGHEGKPIEVEIISRYPAVALYLNDSLVGIQPTDESNGYRTAFTLPYAPGTLRATGVEASGRKVKPVTLHTAGSPANIQVTGERETVPGTDYDLIFVEASILDADGHLNPEADCTLTFGTDAELLATGSADPTDRIAYTSAARDTWRGHAAAVVKVPHGKPATITATAPGLTSTPLTL